MQTTSSTPAAIIKNNLEENNEKKDKPKPTQCKGENLEKNKKIKDTENKKPKVVSMSFDFGRRLNKMSSMGMKHLICAFGPWTCMQSKATNKG